MEKNYITSLTGLRTIAASMVFFHHFNPFPKKTLYFGVVNEFHIGVTIFFVLSGFLIGLRYSDKEINISKYFINRLARIYPVFFLFTVITFLVSPPSGIFESILNFTMLKGLFDEYKFSGIAQGWTLTVEEFFYAFALILFPLVKRKQIFFIFLIPFFLLGITFFFKSIAPQYSFHGFLKDYDFIRNYTFFGRSFEFISGFLLSYYLPKINYKTKYITWIGVFGIIISCISLHFVKGNESVGVITLPGQMINNYILPIFGIIPLIYGLVKEKTIISEILSTKIFELLGKSSYVFYIIHMGVVQVFVNKFFNNYFFVFLIIQVLSIIIFKTFEEPMNKFIKRTFKGKNKLQTIPTK
ncbi:acyltransferase family protein [Chryseobacterium arthrosphaerae]|uniref:acyltransferase family protein n=1 Tax=Chryseobacterium arthrosphaerae TaxID=651561 RepID=UPI00241CF90F|nr:acyltransferase [Chryseobacterium arthrosphaerae]